MCLVVFAVVIGNLDQISKLCFSNSGTYLPFIVAQSSFIIFICEQKQYISVMFEGNLACKLGQVVEIN